MWGSSRACDDDTGVEEFGWSARGDAGRKVCEALDSSSILAFPSWFWLCQTEKTAGSSLFAQSLFLSWKSSETSRQSPRRVVCFVLSVGVAWGLGWNLVVHRTHGMREWNFVVNGENPLPILVA